ncbi:MAG: FAD-dependent oxidoreductase [Clostridia bacterium]|nr:FAD-dependent oxidoreductase [Clostridia bacterium]
MPSYQKELQIYSKSDVVVVGGGPAGIAAAVTAARLGKKVILIEQTGSLGGASVLAMVPELMNFDDGKNFLSTGIGKEIFDNLHYPHKYQRDWHNIRYEQLKRIYDAMVTKSGVEVLFYTHLTDVITEAGRVKYAVIATPNGMYVIKGSFFIDCTGNGSLSCFAGAQYEYGDEAGNTMSATLCSLWGGVDFDKKPKDWLHYEEAYQDDIFSHYDTILPGIKANYPEINVGGGNVGHCFQVDDRDVKSLTHAMFQGRKILEEYETYYQKYVEGCENATLIRSADFIGIRESRRIRCVYTLTADSFFAKESFDDEIGRYSYPIDIHPMTSDEAGMEGFNKSVAIRHEDGDSYSIPYRCLVPQHTTNVLVAGRCIGTDRSMQASVRVIPCCYLTGQAAGAAASVCIDENANAIDANIKTLKTVLKNITETGIY